MLTNRRSEFAWRHWVWQLVSLCLVLIAAPLSAAPSATPDPPFLDQNGAPIVGTVRVLCYETQSASAPVADVTIQTEADGTPDPATPLPANCAFAAALRPRWTQPAHGATRGPAYTIYTTSWDPATQDRVSTAEPVFIRDQWPLTLFDVVASLAWRPDVASEFATPADVAEAVRQASAVLYDLTEGQMAFGSVRVLTGGELWGEADMRFLPAGDRRPSAYVGGIVPSPVAYTTPSINDIVFVPAATYYGRAWDGAAANHPGSGAWPAAAGVRTIAHEWAHYALFLYDEYQQADGRRDYCVCQDLPFVTDVSTGVCGGFTTADVASAMAYHYVATELWATGQHGTPASCTDSFQGVVHVASDWETLDMWETIQGISLPFDPLVEPGALTPGPAIGLVDALFAADLPTGPNADDALIELNTTFAPAQTALWPTQIYILEGDPVNPDRILHQGGADRPFVGQLPTEARLLGIVDEDRARVYVDRYATEFGPPGGQQFYPPLAAADDPLLGGPTLILGDEGWSHIVEHHYQVAGNQIVSLTVRLQSVSEPLVDPPLATLCAVDSAFGCGPAQVMVDVGAYWETTFAPPTPGGAVPRYGVVRLQGETDSDGPVEVVRWMQMGGGVGPGHIDSYAPLVDGEVMVNILEPLPGPGECNLVSYMPATNTPAKLRSLGFAADGNAVLGLVGVPLDVTIVLGQSALPCPVPPFNEDNRLDYPAIITLFYPQDEIDRRSIDETRLAIVHYRSDGEGEAQWEPVAVVDRDVELNWISAEVQRDGIYAVGWTSVPTAVNASAEVVTPVVSGLWVGLALLLAATGLGVWRRR